MISFQFETRLFTMLGMPEELFLKKQKISNGSKLVVVLIYL